MGRPGRKLELWGGNGSCDFQIQIQIQFQVLDPVRHEGPLMAGTGRREGLKATHCWCSNIEFHYRQTVAKTPGSKLSSE